MSTNALSVTHQTLEDLTIAIATLEMVQPRVADDDQLRELVAAGLRRLWDAARRIQEAGG